jgi:hypothetical protein
MPAAHGLKRFISTDLAEPPEKASRAPPFEALDLQVRRQPGFLQGVLGVGAFAQQMNGTSV